MSSDRSPTSDVRAAPGAPAQGADSLGASTAPGRSARLRADCARCCGLCCVAPSFEACQGFGFSKPAHYACLHLQADFRCSIHEVLADRGFPACQAFDCFGAGQRVTQQLFHGQSWRASPETAALMFHAYQRYRALHELLAMLKLAMESPLSAADTHLKALFQSLESLCESGEALSAAVSLDTLRRDVLRQIRESLSIP